MKFNKKQIFKVLGTVSMVVGIIGMFLPVFPTTPFVLLAAYFFFNSSPRLFMRLINNKHLGLPLYIYLKYRSIEFRSKLIALIALWISGTVTMYFISHFQVKLIMFLTFLAVSVYLFSYRNLTQMEKHQAKASYKARYRKLENKKKTRNR